jgi:SAM-dependent methyltransferase
MSVAQLARRWADDLSSWAIPAAILDAAPESPWPLPVELFRPGEPEASSLSRARALERLPGSVLDVGCGAGAASFALARQATKLTGVDEDARMLEAFEAEAPIEHDAVFGRWPDVADVVEPADVVICHHVLYNVPDVVPFVEALHQHARRRVVVELFEEHPLAWMNPLWRQLHRLDRPDRPHASDAYDIVRALHPAARMERWEAPARHGGYLDEAMFAFLRRRLCLTTERDDELRAALARTPQPASRERATIWWDADRRAALSTSTR